MEQTSPEQSPKSLTAAASMWSADQLTPRVPQEDVTPAVLQELRDAGYDVSRTVARGGFGVVYQARDRAQARDVAIKLIDRAGRGADMPPLPQDAATLAALRHPNIVALYDSGTLQAGVCFQVMPWIDGSSLRSRLARDAQLEIPVALQIGIELADALAALHALGLVHRDVKPENVLLDGERAILIDMGLVCAVRRDAEASDASERPIGTPSYMSPEQWTPGAAIDGRADVYGLGCLLYELLTGALRHERNPLHARGQSRFMWTESAHASDLVTPPEGDPWRTRPSVRRRRPDAPVALERLLYRALDPDRDARLASAALFKEELEAIQRAQANKLTPRRGLRALFKAATNLGQTDRS